MVNKPASVGFRSVHSSEEFTQFGDPKRMAFELLIDKEMEVDRMFNL